MNIWHLSILLPRMRTGQFDSCSSVSKDSNSRFDSSNRALGWELAHFLQTITDLHIIYRSINYPTCHRSRRGRRWHQLQGSNPSTPDAPGDAHQDRMWWICKLQCCSAMTVDGDCDMLKTHKTGIHGYRGFRLTWSCRCLAPQRWDAGWARAEPSCHPGILQVILLFILHFSTDCYWQTLSMWSRVVLPALSNPGKNKTLRDGII